MNRTQPALLLAALAAVSLSACSQEGGTASEEPISGDSWTVPALVTDCSSDDVDPAGCTGPSEATEYTSLDAENVTAPWRLCAVIPHLKDSTWVGVNYGLALQAQRLDVNLSVVDAGGYENLSKQVSQIEDCVSSDADAILVSAVSYDSVNQAVQRAMDAGITVVDVGNGFSLPDVPGRVLQDYVDMGGVIGTHLAESAEPLKVAVLPGPAGAGWAERSLLGFQEAIEGSDVEIVDVKYGDTGKEVQLGLIEDVLSANPDIDALVGNAVMVESAVAVLAEQGRTEQVALYGTYVTPETVKLMSAGRANCGPSEQSSLIGQMSVDLAVRLLEQEVLAEPPTRFSPKPLLICGSAEGGSDNVESFDATGSFAPEGWQPVSVVESTR